MKPTLQVVWFKRDLRIEDHEPLAEAARRGPVLPLYVAEPSLLAAPDFDPRHWSFIRGGLIELRRRCFALGQPLVVRTGDAVAVLEEIHREAPFARIWTHEEIGNEPARARDQAVRDWAAARNITLTEMASNGIARGLPAAENWTEQWEAAMRKPLIPPPARLRPATGVQPGPIPDHRDLGLPPDSSRSSQHGGEQAARQTLDRFLIRHGEAYGQDAEGAATDEHASSRIGPYLSWGNLSLRQAVRATRARHREVRALPPAERGNWPAALAAFETRLRDRSYFVQAFADDPSVETEHLDRACEGLREGEFNPAWFDAWAAGQTGYPMVDACMRALRETGWLSYRMRATVVSFASFDLWLHWRETGLLLARLSLDYEPGIHWNRMQYHAGTAGLVAMQVYNPTKQALEHDPHGIFIRRWVPELEPVPSSFIHTPWLLPEPMQRSLGCVIGERYPAPIVDHATASREALRRIHEARGQQPATQASGTVEERAARRRLLRKAPRVKRIQRDKPTQLSLPTD